MSTPPLPDYQDLGALDNVKRLRIIKGIMLKLESACEGPWLSTVKA